MANVEMQYILWGQKEVYKRWLETVKLNFRALESVRELERRVADLRDQKRTVEQGVDLKLYRHYKCELQQRWMNYYEDKLVDELEGAMKQVDPNRLAVIVLPEAMICDYVTEDEAKENGLRARGYVNPLYEETVRKILGPSVSGGAAAARIISDEDGNKTLLKFTADHGQALLFAGTVWLQTSGISLYYGTKELEYDGIYEKTVNLWDEDVICLHGKESIERNINLEELYAIRNSGGYGIEGKIRLYYARANENGTERINWNSLILEAGTG